MSAASLAIGLFNLAKPYLVKVGAWLVEKLIKRGAVWLAKFLRRRQKAFKRRAVRLTKRMLRTRSHSSRDLPEIGGDAARLRWLFARRQNYLGFADFLEANAESLSKFVSGRLKLLAEKAKLPEVGEQESFPNYLQTQGN